MDGPYKYAYDTFIICYIYMVDEYLNCSDNFVTNLALAFIYFIYECFGVVLEAYKKCNKRC